MRIKEIILFTFMAFLPFFAQAQGNVPAVRPSATYYDEEKGEMTETEGDFGGQAPLTATFHANPTGMEGFTPTYEWHFRMADEASDFMVRYEEDTEYTFTKAGITRVTLYANLGTDTLTIDSTSINVTISESKLTFPNAFSPNGDGRNEVFKAKEYQSLVEFHAYIFNRWGHKLYEWTNPAEGWDGTSGGKAVKEGVYFVLVKARGADGREYNIRKDVNLLRGYTDSTNN